MSQYSELLARARDLARARLSEESYAHCERVAATARALAGKHDVDADAAELAGLLHDYCRDETDGGLIQAAEELCVPVLSFER